MRWVMVDPAYGVVAARNVELMREGRRATDLEW
jgi:hypothetical protein